MRSLKLFSHILPYLLTMIFFWIDVSSFIILYHLTTQSLLCFFILQSVSHKPLNNLLFTLFFLALESQLAYGFFGLSLPIWIFIIPLGRFLAINFQLPFLSALGLLISALLTQALIIQWWILGYPLGTIFTNGNIYVNIVIMIILWFLKIMGRQGNRSYSV